MTDSAREATGTAPGDRQILLLVGAVGSGKGTQAAALSRELGLQSLASGNLFRQALRDGTPLGDQAREYMERGELVPDEITIAMLMDELAKPGAARGVIFDGVVRTIPQAEGVERLLSERGRQMDAVLFFDVSDDEILTRLAKRRAVEKRPDDDPDAVATRLRAYRKQTAPVLDWYEERNLVHRIPAVGSVEEIAERVRRTLGK